ncbi:MAG: glutamate 5-kinase [Actinobacteria bacterium]|nr:glutamate 5-kinase [Actinomycetota bacterium]
MSSSLTSERKYSRIVVKVGTSTLTGGTGHIDQVYVEELIAQVAAVRSLGTQVVLVSSGAIGAGLEKLHIGPERPGDIPTLQAAAAVGQIELVKRYAEAATHHGITVAQILLTRHDTSNRQAYLHGRDTLNRLLELEVLPIVNENDTVAVDEIRFGDNDTLAATVASLIGADLVILLSDIEGLYTADPRIQDDAELLSRVGEFTEEIVQSAGGVGSKSGSGGMATKVEAARVLMRADIPMVICEGHKKNVICDIVDGVSVGTLFSNDKKVSTMHAKKLWIALGDKAQGAILVDDGACRALREQGGSLLAVGVKNVVGTFGSGAVVNIRDLEGHLIGRGISRYSSAEIEAAAGHKSSDLACADATSHLANREVVHRDELVLF